MQFFFKMRLVFMPFYFYLFNAALTNLGKERHMVGVVYYCEVNSENRKTHTQVIDIIGSFEFNCKMGSEIFTKFKCKHSTYISGLYCVRMETFPGYNNSICHL